MNAPHPFDTTRQRARHWVGAFRDFILAGQHPCVMARSALNRASVRFGLYGRLAAPDAVQRHLRDLQRLAALLPPAAARWRSHVALFLGEPPQGEAAFEQRLWAHLQALHERDRTSHGWAESVSADPASPDFGFSAAGRPWFVIGLHPQASRWARRFGLTALVFNPHGQFQELRERGRFESLRDTIRERDRAWQGSLNPMLDDHGQSSEARQYAGRAVPEGWRCPFHAQAA